MIAVLRGSVPFLADLVRVMTIRTSVDFVALSPYTPGTGRVRLVMDVATNIDQACRDRRGHADTGLTSAFLIGELQRRNPASVSCAPWSTAPPAGWYPRRPRSADRRPFRDRLWPRPRGDIRLQVLAIADPTVLAKDPDAYVEALYEA